MPQLWQESCHKCDSSHATSPMTYNSLGFPRYFLALQILEVKIQAVKIREVKIREY